MRLTGFPSPQFAETLRRYEKNTTGQDSTTTDGKWFCCCEGGIRACPKNLVQSTLVVKIPNEDICVLMS